MIWHVAVAFQQVCRKDVLGTPLSRLLVTLPGMLGLPARSGLTIDQRIQPFDSTTFDLNILQRSLYRWPKYSQTISRLEHCLVS